MRRRGDPLSPTGVVMIVQVAAVWLLVLTASLLNRNASGLEISLQKKEGLERAPSCMHSFGRIEITNSVRLKYSICIVRRMRRLRARSVVSHACLRALLIVDNDDDDRVTTNV